MERIKRKEKLEIKKKEKMKKEKMRGITLIALVITIIVLLILAGVSIAMLTGENGLLGQANNAKIEQSHSAVREGMALAYNEYKIIINTAKEVNEEIKVASTKKVTIQGKQENQAITKNSSFKDFLLEKQYITEEGKVEVEELLGQKQALGNGKIIDKKDVYILEELENSYILNYYDENSSPTKIWDVNNSNSTNKTVEVNIERKPTDENEKTNSVWLNVESVIVDGKILKNAKFGDIREYENLLNQNLIQMTDEQREKIFVDLTNEEIGEKIFENIDQIIEYAYMNGEIPENSKDAFYDAMGGKEGFIQTLIKRITEINYNLIGEFNPDTLELKGYEVTNPEGENLNSYVATQNGEYTFIIQYYENGQVYTENKTIKVENIDSDEQNYYVGNDNLGGGIYLFEKNTNIPTTFTEAYVLFNNEWKNITQIIYLEESENFSFINGGDLKDLISIGNNETAQFLIIKDGKNYFGTAKVAWPVNICLKKILC